MNCTQIRWSYLLYNLYILHCSISLSRTVLVAFETVTKTYFKDFFYPFIQLFLHYKESQASASTITLLYNEANTHTSLRVTVFQSVAASLVSHRRFLKDFSKRLFTRLQLLTIGVDPIFYISDISPLQ